MKNKFISFLITIFILFSITLISCGNNKITTTPNESNTNNSEIKDTLDNEINNSQETIYDNNTQSENSNSQTNSKSSDYKITTKNYTKNDINITYPQVANIEDSNKLNSINKDLEDIALSPLKLYNIDNSEANSNLYVKINYEIKYQGKDFISVVYTGDLNNGVSAHPTNLFYTANIDLNKGSMVRLSDYYDINKSIDKIKNSDYVNISDNKDLTTAQNDYLSKMESSNIENIIKETDFYRKNGEIQGVEAFSYKDENNIIISIGTIYALGNHIELKLE